MVSRSGVKNRIFYKRNPEKGLFVYFFYMIKDVCYEIAGFQQKTPG